MAAEITLALRPGADEALPFKHSQRLPKRCAAHIKLGRQFLLTERRAERKPNR
jgi:hypothetical protein